MGSEFLASPKALRLPTVRSCYEQQAEMARREGLSYERYLEELPEHERQGRHQRRIERLLRESALPLEKSLGSCDRSRLPPVDVNQAEIMRGDVLWFGKEALTNFNKVVSIGFFRVFLNSLYIAVLATLLSVFCSAMAAYSLSKFNYRGRSFFFGLIIAIMMIPGQLALIASIIQFRWFRWVDTHWPFIVPAISNSFAVFWLAMYMRQLIPYSFIDSARIDGCHEFRIFLQIGLPCIAPALISISLLTFLGSWNNFLMPSLILSSRDLLTVPLGIARLQTYFYTDHAPRIMGLLIGTAPLLILFSFGQKYFAKGLFTGALKG